MKGRKDTGVKCAPSCAVLSAVYGAGCSPLPLLFHADALSSAGLIAADAVNRGGTVRSTKRLEFQPPSPSPSPPSFSPSPFPSALLSTTHSVAQHPSKRPACTRAYGSLSPCSWPERRDDDHGLFPEQEPRRGVRRGRREQQRQEGVQLVRTVRSDTHTHTHMHAHIDTHKTHTRHIPWKI